MSVVTILSFLVFITSTYGQFSAYRPNIELEILECPEHWYRFQDSCYRFIKSPRRAHNEARKICQAYEADLVSINSLEEHGFLIHTLTREDRQRQRWYLGAHQNNPGYWVNEFDGSQLLSLDNAFLPTDNNIDLIEKDYLAYSFSGELLRWGFVQLKGDEPEPFICEATIADLSYLVEEKRTYEYGIEINNPERIPRGPYFIRQPVGVTFDTTKRVSSNDVSLSCLAGGYPTPTYEWFREDYENDEYVARKVDPLSDDRITVSGGTLLIFDPNQKKDQGSYHCRATNEFGSIISESARLDFGFILEFNLKRSAESGNQNWGKAVYCDPPQYFPAVKYYWTRDFFPNFVEEDRRVFVSYDGALYFSALETIDRGNYSCNVQSTVSDMGRNGPFFPLRVNPHSNYQQLKFPNSFPKVFPDAPIVGQEVRLECVAFGYPVPSYNWTRVGGSLPRGSRQSSYSRVLVIPRVQVEDQGEYVCRAYNDRASIQNSVVLNVQAEPNFTIPLQDKHIDNKGHITWTCEAFGIPDVNYTWWRNGKPLLADHLELEDRDRYRIRDNVLTIHYVDPRRDQGMYQCRAANQLKMRYSSARLRALSLRPSFKKRPLESETYAAEQENTTLLCEPEAAPRPTFVWKKDGNVVGSGGRRRILSNGALFIGPVSRDDAGVYTCSASNTYGADESRGRLIVLQKPRLVEYLTPRIVTTVKRNLSLHCRADTEEMLDVAYVWKHDGMLIRDIDIINSDNRLKVEGGYLDIINATFAEAGEYECIVKSAVGSISSKTTITIEGPPGPPGGLQVVGIAHTSVTLQWTDGSANGKTVIGYVVMGRTNWNSTWTEVGRSIDDLGYPVGSLSGLDYDGRPFRRTGVVIAREVDRYTGRKEAVVETRLTPWSVYEFRVSAVNVLGTGPACSPSPRYATPPDRPFRSPYDISGGGGKIGDLTITWTPLPSEEQNGAGIHYKIFWRRKGHDIEFMTLVLREYGNTGMAVVHVPFNFFYTEYEVKVQAINEIGMGPESEVVTIFSAEDMPQVAPQQVVARSYNSTALNVSWIPIRESREHIRGKLIGHRLKYWKKDNAEQDAVYYLSRSTRSWALVVGLQPDTYYFVKVMAYNAAGEGPESERYLERTYRKAPQKPPSAVHVYGVDPSTVRVVWRYVAPTHEEETLIGYKIRVWEIDQDMSSANDTLVTAGDKLEAYVNNLSPGKTYRMRVLAYSSGGDGRMSSPALTFQMGDASQFMNDSSSILPTFLLCAASVILTCLITELICDRRPQL